jgi:metal-responsive CopG/Arc/MetJ family transcriptional regulator
MRIIVDLTEPQIKALDALATASDVSRAALIRAAVATLLEKRGAAQRDEAFGLWKGARPDDGEDGLAYQEKLRAEW